MLLFLLFFSAADRLSGDSLCPNLLLTFYVIPLFDVSCDGLHCTGDNLDDDMELTPLTLDLETGQGTNNNNNENINTNHNILTMDVITEEEGGAMDKTDSKRGSTANSSNNVSRSPSTGDMSPGKEICVCTFFFSIFVQSPPD